MTGPTFGNDRRIAIRNGDAGTLDTLEQMGRMIRDTENTGRVRMLAIGLAADAPNKDSNAQLLGVYSFLREHVNFKRDGFGVEELRHPDQLLSEVAQAKQEMSRRYAAPVIEQLCRAGKGPKTAADCDCTAMLGAALVRALGFRAVLIAVGPDDDGPYKHVFYGVRVGPRTDQVVPYDPQEAITPGNWPAPEHRRKVLVYDVD